MEKYTVAANRRTDYGEGLCDLIYSQLTAIGVTKELLCGKKTVIKPNLVLNKKPETGITTHPDFLRAAVEALKRLGAENVLIAESSGGPYTESTIKLHYNGCGITAAASACGAQLNYDPSAVRMSHPEGEICRQFDVIKPIAEADVIVDLCKLKTHSLTKMTCAVKNLFGVIPGIEKFEMHAAYSKPETFQRMLTELCEMLCRRKTVISICDGILGMEGNGPSGGTPRQFGVVLSSLSPYALNLAAEYILGFEGTVPMVKIAAEKGLAPDKADKLNVLGDSLDALRMEKVEEPEATHNSWLNTLPDLFGGRLVRFLSPRPKINKSKCIGCGECVRSCPKHTIALREKGKAKKAEINSKNCILCYCCQELCPVTAVDIKKNPIIKLVH